MIDDASTVRGFLIDCGYTADGVLARVGSAAFAALGRGTTVPIRRALREDQAARGATPHLDALITLFLLADPVPQSALPATVLESMVGLGLVRVDAGTATPVLDVRPYGEPDTDWYLVSDLGAPSDPEHVLGAGGASLTLARITPRRDVGRALDLGCGSGVQVLHLARHSSHVVATDRNPRALVTTALSAALSGVQEASLDLREGSLFAPVVDEQFDLIVSNPPFVISPGHRFTYRDAGLPGDTLSRLMARGAAAHLAPGGMATILGNWLHVHGESWQDRVAGWLRGCGVSAWVVQRDEQPVADYAGTWLRDAGVPEGPDFDEAMDQWLDAFADEGCTAVGFGWIVLVAPPSTSGGPRAGGDPNPDAGGDPDGVGYPLRRAESDESVEPWILVEDLGHAARLPRGDEVEAFLSGCALVESMPAPAMLAADLRLADGAEVTATTHLLGGALVDSPPRLGRSGSVGAVGWRADVPVPPALLTALLADDGRPIGERLDEAAADEGLDPIDVLGPALVGLRELIRVGIVRVD